MSGATPLAAARWYVRHGYAPILIPHKRKYPRLLDWQKLIISEPELPRYFNGAPMNIGILLGDPSGGRVDADLDCREARLLAPRFLPATGARFGRAGAPLSHWIYTVIGELRQETFRDPRLPDNDERGMVLELRATSPHVSILAHITQEELLRVFDSTDAANGFGNRFLWVCVRRSKLLPEGGRLPEDEAASLVHRTSQALAFARKQSEVRRNDDARALWAEIYPDLSEGKPGMLGALIARAEAHVLRLSELYALLDQSPEITPDPLLAALALWDYCAASARYIFGDSTGDPIADRILAALRANGEMDQSAISDLFGRHVNAGRLGKVLEALLLAGLARSEREHDSEKRGRPRTLWTAR